MERTVLQAADGMIYTNGTDGGKMVYLAVGEDAADWYQIAEEEYLLTVEGGFGRVTEADYQAALREFGVEV